ncbi:MAG: imidazole glycerol phosphate synthase subunit HisH [Bacteroidota bacterium]
MQVAILKYNAGNTRSVRFAFERLGAEVIVTADEAQLRAADRVVFPGVGHARSAMNYLKVHRLDELLCDLSQPVLGICLGLQLMCQHSEEGDTDCLGIFPISVKRFPKSDLKVPHMGWNLLQPTPANSFSSIQKESAYYFVHSYYAETHPEFTLAEGNYGTPFSAILRKNNFWAMQFHPEKSSTEGEALLKSFLE